MQNYALDKNFGFEWWVDSNLNTSEWPFAFKKSEDMSVIGYIAQRCKKPRCK